MQFPFRPFEHLSPGEQQAVANAYPRIRDEVGRLARTNGELVRLPPLQNQDERIAALRESERIGQLKYSMQAAGQLHVWVRDDRAQDGPEQFGYLHAWTIPIAPERKPIRR